MSASEKRLPRILVVDDDDTLRPVLEQELKESGFEVHSARNADEARALLPEKSPDAVVTDIQMPGMNGLELLKWIKDHHPLPVILITGFMELAETIDAAQCGATAFLSKPFRREDLVAALAACFPANGEPDGGKSLDEEFSRIPVEDFVSGNGIKYDIYIRLSASKYVKIAHTGADITVKKMRTFKDKGIQYLYLTKTDFRSYARFNLNISRVVSTNPGVGRDKKLVLLKHAAETIASCAFNDFIDVEVIEDAKGVVDTALGVLLENPDALQLLDSLRSRSDFAYSHSVAVSFCAVMIAKQMGWTSTATFFKLAAGALFHDIGFKDLPRELLEKSKKDLSEEQQKLYESHAEKGARIMSQVKGLPSDVISVALEHHENCIGFGFPKGLKRDKTHPLARLVAVTDTFCRLVLPGPEGPGMKPEKAIERMLTFNSEFYDGDAAMGLMRLFNYPIPERFAEELRWRQKTGKAS